MSTVSTSPTVRKSRPKPARSVRLLLPPQGFASGVVSITVGTKEASYLLTGLRSDFGQGWQLDELGATDQYAVNLSDGARNSTCECTGFLRHGHCKHIAALLTLRTAGRLPAASAKPNAWLSAGQAISTRVDPKPVSPQRPAKPRFRSAGDMAANDPDAYADLNDQFADEYAEWSQTVPCVACGVARHECECQEPF